jgi:hypothetical protein
VCCGGSSILSEARRWDLPVEHSGIDIHVCCVPPVEATDPIRRSPFSPFPAHVLIVSVMNTLDLARIVMVTAALTSLLYFGMSCGLHYWIFIGLFFLFNDLITEQALILLHSRCSFGD